MGIKMERTQNILSDNINKNRISYWRENAAYLESGVLQRQSRDHTTRTWIHQHGRTVGTLKDTRRTMPVHKVVSYDRKG